MIYNPMNHRCTSEGYRNPEVINSFVSWANEILNESFHKDQPIVLIGYKSSGAYLGVPLALSRGNTIYVSTHLHNIDELSIIGKPIFVFVDDYIHNGETLKKAKKLKYYFEQIELSQALVIEVSEDFENDYSVPIRSYIKEC